MGAPVSAVVHDGMTRPAYIEGRPGVSGPIRFSYRPMNNDSYTNYQASMREKATFLLQERFAAASTIGRLVSWDLVYPDNYAVVEKRGTPVPLHRLWDDVDPWVTNRIWSIVHGKSVTDIDPQWSKDDQEGAGKEKLAMENDELAKLIVGNRSEQLGN